tara:strand:- start:1918 stop:2319 length:402 start_codon:yes stop_codon:yes gene_type:complete
MPKAETDVIELLESVVHYQIESDGRLHIYFDTDVVFHFNGNKIELSKNDVVEFVDGDKFSITSGNMHLNPWSEQFFDELISRIIDEPKIRDVMGAKALAFKKQEKRARKQTLRDRLHKYSFNRLKRNKDCSCK